MSGSPAASKNAPSAPHHYEAAIEAAFEDLTAARRSVERSRGQLERDQVRVAGLTDVIRSLLQVLPAERQAIYVQRLASMHLGLEGPTRGGFVFDNVVTLFRRAPGEWTPANVQSELAKEGVHADARAITNVLGYLARTGKITRLARGHYLVSGAGLVTEEELPAGEYGQTRVTEHDV
jgi:hypothetical protein